MIANGTLFGSTHTFFKVRSEIEMGVIVPSIKCQVYVYSFDFLNISIKIENVYEEKVSLSLFKEKIQIPAV